VNRTIPAGGPINPRQRCHTGADKPQFGLTVPFVLAATSRQRTFAAAAATTMLLALLATLAFGPQVWEAFATSTQSPWRYSFHSASSP